MAERVRRRLVAARLSASLAAAALLGGLAAGNGRTEALADDLTAGMRVVEPDSVGTNEVIDHSLLYRDLKRGQVYSQGAVNDRFYLKEDVNRLFVKMDDAVNLFVGGRGSVLAGSNVAPGDGSVSVLDVPGLVRLRGVTTGRVPAMQITNVGDGPLDFATAGAAGVLEADGSVSVELGGPETAPVATVQIVSETSGLLTTLTLSAIPQSGTAADIGFSAQAIIVYD